MIVSMIFKELIKQAQHTSSHSCYYAESGV